MTDPIKAKIIELCPDVIKNKHAQLVKFDRSIEYFEEVRPITLAVVLRAIEEAAAHTETITLISSTAHFGEMVEGKIEWRDVRWNLEHDNYDDQSQETKNFIGSLLGVK